MLPVQGGSEVLLSLPTSENPKDFPQQNPPHGHHSHPPEIWSFFGFKISLNNSIDSPDGPAELRVFCSRTVRFLTPPNITPKSSFSPLAGEILSKPHLTSTTKWYLTQELGYRVFRMQEVNTDVYYSFSLISKTPFSFSFFFFPCRSFACKWKRLSLLGKILTKKIKIKNSGSWSLKTQSPGHVMDLYVLLNLSLRFKNRPEIVQNSLCRPLELDSSKPDPRWYFWITGERF